jgi:anti-anti-sigma factor
VFTGAIPVGRMRAMELQEEQVDAGGVAVTVVAVDGFVDAGTVGELRDTLERLVREGRQRFVIDLTRVPFMDSSGLATLVQTFKRVRIGEGGRASRRAAGRGAARLPARAARPRLRPVPDAKAAVASFTGDG